MLEHGTTFHQQIYQHKHIIIHDLHVLQSKVVTQIYNMHQNGKSLRPRLVGLDCSVLSEVFWVKY
jgi:hypothetical protein